MYSVLLFVLDYILYILSTVDPFRIYVFEEGLARFATIWLPGMHMYITKMTYNLL